jgi:hypothetical protein
LPPGAGWRSPAILRRVRSAQRAAYKLFVGNHRYRARCFVKNGKLTESAPRVGRLQIRARGSFGDDQRFLADLVFAKDDCSGRVGGALQIGLYGH